MPIRNDRVRGSGGRDFWPQNPFPGRRAGFQSHSHRWQANPKTTKAIINRFYAQQLTRLNPRQNQPFINTQQRRTAITVALEQRLDPLAPQISCQSSTW